MKGFIKELWWLLLLSGIALLFFGLAAVVWPEMTLNSLAFIFAVYVIVSGIIDMLVSLGAMAQNRAWFLTLILGVIEIAAGVYVLKTPGMALEAFVYTAGLVFMAQGIFSIIVSFVDTADAGIRILEIVSGILGIVAGFIMFRNPVTAGLTFVWVLGVYGLIAGTIRIATALSLRHTVEELETAVGIRK